MNYIQVVTKIRGRGQLTIPQQIREALGLPAGDVAVKVETTTGGFKVEPLPISHPQSSNKRLTTKEAEKIWADLQSISKIGKSSINLTTSLRHDRDSHF